MRAWWQPKRNVFTHAMASAHPPPLTSQNCSICKEAHLARQQFHVTQQQTVAVLVAVALCIAAAKATHQTPVLYFCPTFARHLEPPLTSPFFQ